jgi:Uncharacterised nucleotidyltransferase
MPEAESTPICAQTHYRTPPSLGHRARDPRKDNDWSLTCLDGADPVTRFRKSGALARPPRLAPLLKAAAEGREDLALSVFDETSIHGAIAVGLGPLLFHVTRHDPARTASPLWAALQSAHLTALVMARVRLEALAEVIQACGCHGSALTLLKGISICQQHYPEPSLRSMRDVDFLVAASDLPVVERALRELDYEQRPSQPAAFYHTHHHTVPFFDKRRGVWMEVHRGLASAQDGRPVEDVLGLEHLRTNLRPAEVLGWRATRLSDELQVVYIASHWARGFNLAGGVFALLDMIYLMKRTDGALAWDTVVTWLAGAPAAAASLYALLDYLDRRELIAVPRHVLPALRRRQRSFGRLNLSIVYAVVDAFMLGGAAWKWSRHLDRLGPAWRALFLPDSPSRNLARLPTRLVRAMASPVVP